MYWSVTEWKVVQEYEHVYVTYPLNPLSRKGDLPSLRSNSFNLYLFLTMYWSGAGWEGRTDLGTSQ